MLNELSPLRQRLSRREFVKVVLSWGGDALAASACGPAQGSAPDTPIPQPILITSTSPPASESAPATPRFEATSGPPSGEYPKSFSEIQLGSGGENFNEETLIAQVPEVEPEITTTKQLLNQALDQLQVPTNQRQLVTDVFYDPTNNKFSWEIYAENNQTMDVYIPRSATGRSINFSIRDFLGNTNTASLSFQLEPLPLPNGYTADQIRMVHSKSGYLIASLADDQGNLIGWYNLKHTPEPTWLDTKDEVLQSIITGIVIEEGTYSPDQQDKINLLKQQLDTSPIFDVDGQWNGQETQIDTKNFTLGIREAKAADGSTDQLVIAWDRSTNRYLVPVDGWAENSGTISRFVMAPEISGKTQVLVLDKDDEVIQALHPNPPEKTLWHVAYQNSDGQLDQHLFAWRKQSEILSSYANWFAQAAIRFPEPPQIIKLDIVDPPPVANIETAFNAWVTKMSTERNGNGNLAHFVGQGSINSDFIKRNEDYLQQVYAAMDQLSPECKEFIVGVVVNGDEQYVIWDKEFNQATSYPYPQVNLAAKEFSGLPLRFAYIWAHESGHTQQIRTRIRNNNCDPAINDEIQFYLLYWKEDYAISKGVVFGNSIAAFIKNASYQMCTVK